MHLYGENIFVLPVWIGYREDIDVVGVEDTVLHILILDLVSMVLNNFFFVTVSELNKYVIESEARGHIYNT
jgi:hypothetical protein